MADLLQKAGQDGGVGVWRFHARDVGAALIQGARFDLIEGAAHIPCVETPDAHAAILTRFLKEIGHA